MIRILGFLVSTLAMLIMTYSFGSFADDVAAQNMVTEYKYIIENTDVYMNNSLAFYDMDGDGLPEMFIGSLPKNSGVLNVKVWTYHDGAVKQAGTIDLRQAIGSDLYSDNGGIFAYYCGEYMGDGKYYSLDSNGNMYLTKTMTGFLPEEYKNSFLLSCSGYGMNKYDALIYVDMFCMNLDIVRNFSSMDYIDPVGIYVPDEGVLRVDEHVPMIRLVKITKNSDGLYDADLAFTHKRASYDPFSSLPANTPVKIVGGYKGNEESHLLTYNGKDTITVQDEDGSNAWVFHRIYDSIMNHVAME